MKSIFFNGVRNDLRKRKQLNQYYIWCPESYLSTLVSC
jgi:hypothetical protein